MDELTNFAAIFYAVDRGEVRGHNQFKRMERVARELRLGMRSNKEWVAFPD
jgi:hypothetical protein